MHRRNFVRQSLLLAATGIALPSCFRQEKTPVKEASFVLKEKDLDQLQTMMRNGEYTSEKITQLYMDEIGKVDAGANGLNAVIELNPQALDIARKMDEERRQGKLRGPMHGIPVLIKDNIDTADSMHTTAGSLALADNIAPNDAFVVGQLRLAGAVILGKTNLSEWANFRSSRSSSGWSSGGGQTHNPYVLDRSPCGSSSGSAVAVAANLCAVSIGTETDGSIACPASMNGVVGIKPTVGLVSRSGIIPISRTQDTAGPFGRTVRDAAILLSVVAGVDPADAVTVDNVGNRQKDYTKFLDRNGLKGKRIGVEKTFLKKHEGIDALLAKALQQLRSAGAEIVEVEFMKANQELGGAEFTVLQYEFKDGLNKYLAKSNSKMRSLADVITFNKTHAKEAMPYFMQETLESSEAKGDLNSEEYKA
ncbi:MAG: amidase, partial [Mucilaginibacter polytrichastri]|nr:amidase [Mucilaginibacter polytrichastri]